MPHYQRWLVLLALAFTSLILITTMRNRLVAKSLTEEGTKFASSCPTLPPSDPIRFRPDETFSWRNIAVKNPVQAFSNLPTNQPAKMPKVQHESFAYTSPSVETLNFRREAVKGVFVRGWRSYKEHAFLHDELAPVSGGFTDTFGGWGATLVDSLDTLWIMGLLEEFNHMVAAAYNISFRPGDSKIDTVNMFETTIRYLGGFLAAYDLTQCQDYRLLEKAVQVGDMIYASYDTPERMPVTRWNIRDYDKQQLSAEHGIIAELASASLELTRLSQLTGDMRYYDTVARITDLLIHNQNLTQLPGMFPVAIGTRGQDFYRGTTFSFGAMADSAFEYFGKTWQLLQGREPQYEQLYSALDVASSHLLYRPKVPDEADILMAAGFHTDTKHRDNQVQHLSCFAGGMYLLGGRLFGNESHTQIGKKLTDGCVWAYKHAPLGIMPEILEMAACPNWDACPYDWDQASPFTEIGDSRYILRPEAIESVFYAYRITGDPVYQDVAWEMFEAINKHTTTRYGNAAIKNVMSKEVEHEDSAESFWFAETLKYFFLIFSDPDLLSLDDWVFNTEAHPFRLPKAQR